MKGCYFVIDTKILVIAQSPENERTFDALALLSIICRSHYLVLDEGKESKIYKEYKTYLDPRTHISKWWKKVTSRGKIFYRPCKLSPKHSQRLIEMGFSDKDLEFVGTASNTLNKYLIAEERHYSEPVKDYLLNELGIKVLSISEALKIAQDP